MDGPTTVQRCVDALDRIDQDAKMWEERFLGPAGRFDRDLRTVRHSVEAMTWILQNTTVSAEKLEVFVSRMCESYGVEGP
jgi:hypothetical protein